MPLQKNEDSREITRGEMEKCKKASQERGILQCARGRERILMTAVWQHLRFIAVYMKRR
jgi:hypothetical protein